MKQSGTPLLAARNLRRYWIRPRTVCRFLSDAMEITGHKTRSVFDRYHIVDTQDVSNAMQQWEDIRKEWRKACAAVDLDRIIEGEGNAVRPSV